MRMRKRLLIALFAGLLTGSAGACINETGTNRRGEKLLLDEPPRFVAQGLVTPTHLLRSDIDWARRVIESAHDNPTFENLNELAVVLMRFDRPADAARLLEVVEKRFPGHWQSAPNLGTAYELAGDDRRALQWIREGIRRNPQDHDGSEWLHVAILQAKLARTPVLGLDFGAAPLPSLPARLPSGNDGKPVSLQGLALALQVQTRERAQFVRAPNPVMAELLFDQAQMQLVAGTMEMAKFYYAAAARYGYTDRQAIARGQAEADRVIANASGEAGNCLLCNLH